MEFAVADLKRRGNGLDLRGLLLDTSVCWGGEIGL